MTRCMLTSAFPASAKLARCAFVVAIAGSTGCIYINSNPENAPDALRIPQIRQAYRAKEAIQKQGAVVKQLGNELDGAVTRIAYQVPHMQSNDAKTQLIAAVRSLRDSAREVLDRGTKYLDALERLSTDMQTGHRSFSGASKLFETFAAEEPYQAIADDYRQLAQFFAELSRRCNTAQTKFIEKFNRAEFLETLQYIRHQERLPDRFEAALVAAFDDPELLEIQDYLAQLNAHAKKYEAFRVQIRDLNRLIPLLEQAPASPNGNSEHPKTTPSTANAKQTAERRPPAPSGTQPSARRIAQSAPTAWHDLQDQAAMPTATLAAPTAVNYEAPTDRRSRRPSVPNHLSPLSRRLTSPRIIHETADASIEMVRISRAKQRRFRALWLLHLLGEAESNRQIADLSKKTRLFWVLAPLRS